MNKSKRKILTKMLILLIFTSFLQPMIVHGERHEVEQNSITENEKIRFDGWIDTVEVTSTSIYEGDSLSIKAKVTDKESKLDKVVFHLVNTFNSHEFKVTSEEIDESGYYTTSITDKDYNNITGEYYVRNVELFNSNGELLSPYLVNSFFETKFYIHSLIEDTIKPTIDISSIVVTPKQAKVGDTVKTVFRASDEGSGIHEVSLFIKNENGYSTIIKSNEPEKDGYYTIEYEIKENTQNGKWEALTLKAIDRSGNEVALYDVRGSLNIADFEVINPEGDSTAPVADLSSLKIEKKYYQSQEKVRVSLKASDQQSGITSIAMIYKNESESLVANSVEEIDGYYTFEFNIADYTKRGLWKISGLILKDANENPRYYRDEPEFAQVEFTVLDEMNSENIFGLKYTVFDHTMYDQNITGDVYVGPKSILTIRGNVNISGNLYILGRVISYGNITVNNIYGTALDYSNESQLRNGYFTISAGKANYGSFYALDQPIPSIPMEIISKNTVNELGEIPIFEGYTLPIADLYINDKSTPVSHDGHFMIENYKVGSAQSINIKMIDIYGKTFNWDYILKNSNMKIVESIKVTELPDKLNYYIGENLDLNGLVVQAFFEDGSKENVDRSQLNILGFNNERYEEGQEITVEYEGHKASFKINMFEKSVQRLEGANRYGTAVEISKASYDKSDIVVLVQSNNFPDALAAGPLAYMLNAPILLTSSKQLSTTTSDEIARLKAKKIIIMGGYGAVSSNVEESLRSEGYSVQRLEGSNRYSTAVVTANYMKEMVGSKKTVVLTSGNQFADALSAGSYAAKEGYPILLTDGSKLTTPTLDYITQYDIDNIIIVGGASVINVELETQLKKLGINVIRKSGKNRFETSLELTQNYFNNAQTAIVANGMEFADALAAAPYAAMHNAPILLVSTSKINLSIQEYITSSMFNNIQVVGGNSAVSEFVISELNRLMK